MTVISRAPWKGPARSVEGNVPANHLMQEGTVTAVHWAISTSLLANVSTRSLIEMIDLLYSEKGKSF